MSTLLWHTGESGLYCKIGISESIFQPANQVGDTMGRNYFRIKLFFVGKWGPRGAYEGRPLSTGHGDELAEQHADTQRFAGSYWVSGFVLLCFHSYTRVGFYFKPVYINGA